ncbi:collagen alpha-1(I) chain-like [Haliaeetus albicilla]|uniref:collagen alpha-1(I) chain-like n=1 Tax=Haliaeetus albicilla TaxID=8969 RepID=UPI0037E708F9
MPAGREGADSVTAPGAPAGDEAAAGKAGITQGCSHARRGPAAACPLRGPWVPRALSVRGGTIERGPGGRTAPTAGEDVPKRRFRPARAPRARGPRLALGPSGIPLRAGARWRQASQTPAGPGPGPRHGGGCCSRRRPGRRTPGCGPAALIAAATEGTGRCRCPPRHGGRPPPGSRGARRRAGSRPPAPLPPGLRACTSPGAGPCGGRERAGPAADATGGWRPAPGAGGKRREETEPPRFTARGLQRRGGNDPARRGNGNRSRRGTGNARAVAKWPAPGLPFRAAPPLHGFLGAVRSGGSRGNEGADGAGKRRSRRAVTTREKRPGRAREAPAPGHSPARRARPAPRGLASAPFRALRGGRILITTKSLCRDPPPRLRCARSPRRGGAEPSEGLGGRGARPRDRGNPRRAAPGCWAGARRSPGAGDLAVRMGLDKLARWVTRRDGGVVAPRGRSPPVTGGRNETKRNERKRKETKGNAEGCGVALPAPAPRHRGPGLPARPGPARPGRAWLSQGCGDRSSGGGGARLPPGGRAAHRLRRAGAGGTLARRGGRICGGTGGFGAGRLRVRRAATVRPGRRGRRRLREECGAAEAKLPSAPRPGRREALAGPGGRAGGAGRPGRRGRTCSPLPGPGRAVCGQGPAGRAGAGVPTYLRVLSTGRRGGRGSLRGPRPRRTVPAPAGRVPGRRGALRGSGLPERSLNTLLFLAGRPEPGRGPALPPPPSNGEAAPGPRPLLAVTCRPGAEEAPEPLAVPAEAVTKRRPPAPG